jgi:hypothetical protein
MPANVGMPSSRTLVLVFFAVHVLAITVAAIPDPRTIPPVESRPAASSFVRSVDRGARAVFAVSERVWRWSAWIRPVTTQYVNSTAQHQRWHMFSGPLTVNELVRLRYYVARDGLAAPLWTATQVVFPSHPDQWWRGLDSFRNSYRDKAVMTALGDFRDRLTNPPDPESVPDNLVPVASYFTAAFAQQLAAGEHVVRSEIWYARVPIPGVSGGDPDVPSPPLPATKAGAVERRDEVPAYRQPFAREVDAGATWLLLYAQDR